MKPEHGVAAGVPHREDFRPPGWGARPAVVPLLRKRPASKRRAPEAESAGSVLPPSRFPGWVIGQAAGRACHCRRKPTWGRTVRDQALAPA